MITITSSWARSNLFLIDIPDQPAVFVADGSRVYDITTDTADAIHRWQRDQLTESANNTELEQFLESALLKSVPYIDKNSATPTPTLNSISINLAQVCNMGCGYCYANEGKFNGKATTMKTKTALDTIDILFLNADPSQPLLVGFMGGETLLARSILQETVTYAWQKALDKKREIAFSITTNATLITPEDAAFFHRYPFTVTVSIDGTEQVHNAARPMRNGSPSYQKVLNGISLLREKRPRHLSARVTVTPLSGALLPLLDHLIALDFDDVGFSAVLVSPDPSYAFNEDDFLSFTQEMIKCGKKAISEWTSGRKYPFGNLLTAIDEIHKGTHRPYPCGAGAGYMSVDTTGNLYACHRLVGDADYLMGNIYKKSDGTATTLLLRNKHVDSQAPCNVCWARYLCGGGCYHEIKHRGRIACDYIRSWVSFSLQAYIQLSNLQSQPA